jgi:hypothetical protein
MSGLASLAASCLAAVQENLSIRGKLTRGSDGKPALGVDSHKLIGLHGDDDTNGVLNDQRILNTDFEAVGHYTSADRFELDGIHTRAMFVHKDGKRLMITYWCDVCYIRTYTPGTCVCCQAYTDLDLRETDDESH